MKTVLVTGGTGFLGRHILEELLAHGYAVRALVRNLQQVTQLEGVSYVEGDVLDVMSLEIAMEGVDVVVHAAAMVSFWEREKAQMMRVNVGGTENVVNMCLDNGNIQKLVFVSSIAALGRTEGGEKIHEKTVWKQSPLNSAYAVSKHKAEMEVQRGVIEGQAAVMVNPGLILGEGNWENSSGKLFSIVHKGLPVYNRGVNGVVGVKDVAAGIRLALESQFEGGERFVLVAENMSQKEMFGLMAESIGKRPPRYEMPPLLATLAGRVSVLLAALTGKKPMITPETVRTSLNQFYYDGTLATRALGLNYTPMKAVIAKAGEIFLRTHT